MRILDGSPHESQFPEVQKGCDLCDEAQALQSQIAVAAIALQFPHSIAPHLSAIKGQNSRRVSSSSLLKKAGVAWGRLGKPPASA